MTKQWRLWDVDTGESKARISGNMSCTLSVAFSPDGDTLAIGEWNSEVYLFDVASGERKAKLSRHSSRVSSVAFSPDGRRLVSGSWDGTALLWNVTPFVSQQQQPDMVRLVYFRPSDRAIQANVDINISGLIKGVQNFYAAQMQRHEGKTFTFETDTIGNAVVHHVNGKYTDAYYQSETYNKVQKEIGEQFDTSKHVYLIAIDVNSEQVNDGNQGHVCGIGGGGWQSLFETEAWQRDFGGLAVIPASGVCF